MTSDEFDYFAALLREVWRKALPDEPTDRIGRVKGAGQKIEAEIENHTLDRIPVALSQLGPVLSYKTINRLNREVFIEGITSGDFNAVPKTKEILARYALGKPKLTGEILILWDEKKEYEALEVWNEWVSTLTNHRNSIIKLLKRYQVEFSEYKIKVAENKDSLAMDLLELAGQHIRSVLEFLKKGDTNNLYIDRIAKLEDESEACFDALSGKRISTGQFVAYMDEVIDSVLDIMNVLY